ncbi:alpha/beta hydrolase family protein [Litoribrevibacter albus]|uniref:Alpha/beta hydrolase n=1 Tax=Litoribrevibacter albus TaxID=1473156 RepID=A0AA37SCL0_9GAMM|nr:alpha/beta fold hydrolase [Litoribrevibacter albus]GLQ32483.1 alpha/beta hydrolase [Litoribrevibacter albus]
MWKNVTRILSQLAWLGLCLSVSIHAETVRFEYGINQLEGHYLAPTNDQPPKAVLLLVHGDGASSFDAEGFYELIWQPLREQGYAIFSWDKPGVGGSTGNWLTMTMTHRQGLVATAAATVQQRFGFEPAQTGALAFSQAGWVMPELLADSSSRIGFAIGIGFATSWIDQGRYYTATRLRLEDATPEDIKQGVAGYDHEIAFFDTSPSYDEYLKWIRDSPMDRDRFYFVLRNYQSNVSEAYRGIQRPTLLLWGDSDLNVDAEHELAQWQMRTNPWVSTKKINNATHAMLRADQFSGTDFGMAEWLKLMWLEEEALAPDFLPTLIRWLDEL